MRHIPGRCSECIHYSFSKRDTSYEHTQCPKGTTHIDDLKTTGVGENKNRQERILTFRLAEKPQTVSAGCLKCIRSFFQEAVINICSYLSVTTEECC